MKKVKCIVYTKEYILCIKINPPESLIFLGGGVYNKIVYKIGDLNEKNKKT